MKKISLLLLLSLLLVGNPARATSFGILDLQVKDEVRVYFDLGNTLISSSTDEFQYLPGIPEYLAGLKSAGFVMGLIVNIPESWGQTAEQKEAALKNFVTEKWVSQVPFDWDLFSEVVLPQSDLERKPAPDLFRKIRISYPQSRILFIGEEARELKSAWSECLAVFHFKNAAGLPETSKIIPHVSTNLSRNPLCAGSY